MSENNKTNQYKISEFDKLVVDIRNNLTTRLTDLMSKLLNSAQEDLFDLSEAADNNEDQTRYFELMNQLRTQKSIIASNFDIKVREYLIPAKDYEAKNKAQKSDDEGELSLIDQDEMEAMVLVKGIGERAGSKYREQLSHLEARLEHLALKTDTVFNQSALVPTNFCQAFNDALTDDFDNINKKILFGMFDIEIANKLDALYDSINNRLIDADILPQIKLHTQKQKHKPRPKTPQGADQTDESQQEYIDDGQGGGYAGGGGGQQAGGNYAGGDGGQQAGGNYAGGGGGQQGGGNYAGGGGGQQAGGNYAGGGGGQQAGGNYAGGGGGQQGGAQTGGGGGSPGGSNISGFAMTAAPGGNYRNTSSGTGQAQQGESGQAGNTGGGQNNDQNGGQNGGHSGGGGSYAESHSGGQNTNDGQTEYQHYTAGMPASQVGRVVGNYMGGSPITPEAITKSLQNEGEYYPESTPQHFGHQEIIQALSNIQNLPQFDQPQAGVPFDGEAIKQAVLAEIAKTSGGAVTKRINQIAEKTIDFIELIFDAIIDDEDISDAIKTILLRLQIPIIKASMSDQEFFIYDDHPARLLLDSIADVGVGVTEHTDEMYVHLDKIISNILGEYHLTTETFQNALDNLSAIIDEQEAIAREKEEEEQKQLLRKHARATVLKALRATTTGKSLPEAVHPLILKRWPTLMFNHYLSNGKENNEWVNIVLTLRHIVESVQPITSAEDLAKILSEKDDLFSLTEDYLNVASNSKKDVKNVMQTYRETIESHAGDANFSEEEVSVAEEIVSNAEPVEEAPIEEEIEKQNIPSNIMPGMWFQLYMGEDSTPRRCKLSVIIVEDANLMFVNHKGELITEKSFTDFNEEISNNQTKVIMGHSAFDHAFKSVINRLN